MSSGTNKDQERIAFVGVVLGTLGSSALNWLTGMGQRVDPFDVIFGAVLFWFLYRAPWRNWFTRKP